MASTRLARCEHRPGVLNHFDAAMSTSRPAAKPGAAIIMLRGPGSLCKANRPIRQFRQVRAGHVSIRGARQPAFPCNTGRSPAHGNPGHARFSAGRDCKPTFSPSIGGSVGVHFNNLSKFDCSRKCGPVLMLFQLGNRFRAANSWPRRLGAPFAAIPAKSQNEPTSVRHGLDQHNSTCTGWSLFWSAISIALIVSTNVRRREREHRA